MEYPVHETFHSWQGEGDHSGKSAFFVRLYGCPVHCPWCDSAGTWHPDYVPDKVDRIDAAMIADAAAAVKSDLVVITGGEPTIHDLGPLTNAMKERGLKSHLETSGSFQIRGSFDWITLSPKWLSTPLPESLTVANELKLIIEDESSVQKWVETLGNSIDKRSVWLHPEWSVRKDPRILESITEFVKKNGAPFRAGLQGHKYYRADLLDRNSAKPSPLGGNPMLGY